MAEAVLDASAVLAFLQREPGEEIVRDVMPRALLCSVNLTEIVSKLTERGLDHAVVRQIACGLPYQIVDYDLELAMSAGILRNQTRSAGLSLGDRACLALAARERLPALTTDRGWAQGDFGVEVQVIRPRPTT